MPHSWMAIFVRTGAIMLFCSLLLQDRTSLGQDLREENKGVLVPRHDWSCVLAGQQATFAYHIAGSQAGQQSLDWALSGDGRLLARGTVHPQRATAGSPQLVSISIEMPEVRPGVVLSVTLRLAGNIDSQMTTAERALYIFSPEPFAEQSKLLAELPIMVFDPIGDTVAILDKQGIPYRRIFKLSQIAGSRRGAIIVGEGIDLERHRRVVPSLFMAARDGLTVLCLAPSSGILPLSLKTESGKLRPSRLALESVDVVRRFDKRLDTSVWAAHGSVRSTFELQQLRGVAALAVTENHEGWPWAEMVIGTGTQPGSLIVCGFALVKQWDSSPVPRYLLAGLLREFANTNSFSRKEN